MIVAGAGYSEETEREEPVKLYAKDYQMLHDSGHDHSDYRFHQLLQEQFHELDTLEKMIERDISTVPSERDPFHSPLEDFDR